MQLSKKRLCQMSAVLCGVAIVGALTPRTLHAVAATLVEVTNTIGNPVIAVPVERAASQQIMLVPPFNGGVANGFEATLQQLTPGGTSGSSYVVPAGMNLVVTGINMDNSSAQTGYAELRVLTTVGGAEEFVELNGTPAGFQQLHFSNGFVFPAGSQVIIDDTNGAASFSNVTVLGYLTPQ